MKIFSPLILCVLSLLCASVAPAQSFNVTGRVSDTLNARELHLSTITLIRASDSILESFTRSKPDGSFTVTADSAGKYIVMISFPSFADYVDIVSLTAEKPSLDMGTIPMVSKSHLLSEFVLKQQIGAIKIKGDTVEYMADSFGVRENATVEELLKKLPGIQVNKNGEVVAQGEKVQKILVDGEEFFTDDPAVVTKSLQAKTVEKVQVFDKKSDQSEFTGIDDGTREKTINLHLKENMKKGYFGKLNVGGGTDGFFENQGMINAFKAKRKLSAFGIVANTGKMGLGWQDRDKYGSSGSNVVDFGDGDMVYITGGSDDENVGWNGQYTGQGIPVAWTGGLHYSNKWNEDKLHLSSNYRFARQNIEKIGNTITQYNDTGGQYYTVENNNSFSTGDRHRVDGLFEWKVDSTSSLKITANAGYANTNTRTHFDVQSRDSSDVLFNENVRNMVTDATTKHINATMAYRKKFQKKGRTLSVTLDERYRENTSEGFLSSDIHLYDIQDSRIFINQRKENESKEFNLTGTASYTEPLSKVMFLEVNYGLTVNNSYANRISFNAGTDGEYDIIDSLFSSKYDFNVLTNAGGSNLRFVFKKVNFSFGGSVAATGFKQVDNFSGREFTRNYTNFFPKVSFVYRPAQQRSFSINYNGSTQQPTIEQIQPIRQNQDPLHVSIGNEDLRQKFSHRINARFNDYKILSGTYTYMGGGVTFIDDDISRSETIDTNRIRFYKYINVDGNYNGYFYGGYGKEFRKLNMRAGLGTNIGVSRYVSYINDVRNVNHNNNFTLRLDASYNKEKKLDISFRPSVTYNTSKSSINSITTNYFTYNLGLEGSVQLPYKFEVGTEVDWNIREEVAGFNGNNNALFWNAYLSRKFLKGDNLELRAYVNDILNQNIGFQRYVSGNTVYQESYNTINRYGMLSLIWNFTKSPAMAAPSEEGSQIIIK